MKNKVQKILKQILCVILSLAMLNILAVNAFAESAEAQPIYLKDVQLIYAESKREAEAQVPKGYKLLKDDLNKGADTDYQVYFAYTTTTDPSEAITDIKMMNMNGGFVLSDYEEQMQNVQDNIKKMANELAGENILYLQKFKDCDTCIKSNLEAVPKTEAEEYQKILSKKIKNVILRGY
jgi:hypothetical protein